MTDKPKWIKDATEEIRQLASDCGLGYTVRWKPQVIEAIILKYCSQDKAGKLVEAFIEARVRLGFPVGTQPDYTGNLGHDFQAMVDTVKIIDAALAEYEKVKP